MHRRVVLLSFGWWLLSFAIGPVGIAVGQPADPAAGAGCPELVTKLNAGRQKVKSGNLITAKLDYYEPLLEHDALKLCRRDLQLKIRREYGDVLARIAKNKDGDDAQEYKKLAADQYKAYLTMYAEVQADDDVGYPRIVLNAYTNMMFETGSYGDLCDLLAEIAKTRPALFDSKVIEKWNKCFNSAGWDNPTKAARLDEYCSLFKQAALSVSRAVRAQFGSDCANG